MNLISPSVQYIHSISTWKAKMQITNKFRLYPNQKTESKLLDVLELHRQTYNTLLAELNNPKELWQREHECHNCGFVVPRDYNSALEIKRLMLIEIGQELSESTPMEMEALPMVTSVIEVGSLFQNKVFV